MRRFIVFAAPVFLLGCQTPVAEPQPECKAVKRAPWKIVHDPKAGFVFCDQNCPEPTGKMLYVAVDLAQDDPRQRVLARLRSQMAGKPAEKTVARSGEGGEGKATKSMAALGASPTPVLRLAPGGASSTGGEWAMYAIEGSPDNPRVRAALAELLRATPKARFHVFAGEQRAADAQATVQALRELGVAPGSLGQFALQLTHGSDAGLAATKVEGASPAATDPRARSTTGAPLQLMVIKK